MFRILTETGIEKLDALKKAIIKLPAYDRPEGSDYSTQMRQRVIKIIDYIVKNNGVSLLANTSEIRDDIAFLDDGKSSLLPDIFNLESLQLAKLLLATLNSINHLTDFTPFAYTLAKKDRVVFFTSRLKKNIEYKINFYNQMLLHEKQAKDFIDILANAEVLANNIINANSTELDNAIKRYLHLVPVLLEVFQNCHYHRLSNASSLVRQDRPFIIQAEKLESLGLKLLLNLLDIEDKINIALKKLEKPSVMVIYTFCKDAYLPGSEIEMNNQFLSLVKGFLSAAESYKTGAHLPFFKSVNPKKIAILDTAINTLKAVYKSDYPLVSRIFAAFKCLTTAAHENATLAKSKDQSLGELSKSLHQFQMSFLHVTLSLNYEHDQRLFDAIKKYEQKLIDQSVITCSLRC